MVTSVRPLLQEALSVEVMLDMITTPEQLEALGEAKRLELESLITEIAQDLIASLGDKKPLDFTNPDVDVVRSPYARQIASKAATAAWMVFNRHEKSIDAFWKNDTPSRSELAAIVERFESAVQGVVPDCFIEYLEDLPWEKQGPVIKQPPPF